MKDEIDVLIVDDDADLPTILQELLADLGLTVTCAVNGRDGYTKALELRPRLIISDVMMPIMRGDDMLNALRGHPETAEIPCILMTAAPAMVRIDVPHLIAKPFDLAQLETIVARYLTIS
ncbi:MAG: hypothetical protein NVS2B16_07960 [Chloroflexota bacterium]